MPETIRRPHLSRFRCLVTVAVVALLTVLGFSSGLPGAAAAQLSRQQAQGSGPLTMTVLDLDPRSPAAVDTQRLTINVLLKNTTSSDLNGVALSAARAYPVASQQALDSSLQDSTLPANLQSVAARPADVPTFDVAAGQSVEATFATTTGTLTSNGLCLCANAVYPIYVTARIRSSGRVLGYARTYLHSRDGGMTKVGVSWVWPLIDRPHRLVDGRVFLDDSLTGSVADDGRLDRALRVVESVGPSVPITLVIDPELIDELSVMATGHYTVQAGSERATAGSGATEAASWLSRLAAVLNSDPEVTVQLTPYADPDVEALTQHGLTWKAQLPATMAKRVAAALPGVSLNSTLSWPAGDALSSDSLDQLTSDGMRTFLLGQSTVSPGNVAGGNDTSTLPASLARLHSASGPVRAALTSSAMEADVASAVRTGNTTGSKLAGLPQLLAEIAVRADQEPTIDHVAFLSPPRYVDPDPTAAETVIQETSRSTFSTPISLSDAVTGSATPNVSSRLRRLDPSATALPRALLQQAVKTSSRLPAVRSLLTGKGQLSTAVALLTALPRALQRSESAGWRAPMSTVNRPGLGVALSAQLRRQVNGVLSAVQIVRPRSGTYSYTLASSNSPIPITVENNGPYRAFIRIQVSTADDLPGLTTTDINVQTLQPNSKQTFHIPTQVQRSGRIELIASLDTSDGRHELGSSVRLSVHSTVFGTIGVVITVIAAVVLLLALALRYVRRILRIRSKRRSPSVKKSDPRAAAEASLARGQSMT